MDWVVTHVLGFFGDWAKPVSITLYTIFTILGIYGWSRRYNSRKVQKKKGENIGVENPKLAAYVDDLNPRLGFQWQTTEPLKFRSFKPKYHLTMALEISKFDELIEMDKNYLSRVNIRRKIISEHRDIVLQASPLIKPAVDELYIYLFNIYLPVRYPSMFRLTSPLLFKKSTHLYNMVTKQPIALAPPTDPIRAFEILGEHLDEEFLLLIPSEDGDGYVLQGYVTCFPSGFNVKEKFGLKLRDIHGPVPGYKEKLEISMDRFFERLEVGRIVKRSNWSITTHDELYTPSGSHLYDGDETEAKEIDMDKTRLRCERQMLWRLPQTKALVFNFKTYLYPLQDIKDEGLGEDLATAIDGLKEGSIPAMHFYKQGVMWGETVKAFLRS
ncbi:hypothetical protein BGZ60DRAFT_419851 [Tricladium varicosporioides]|nr:hypothetical protein BGZ60DRAFT_419851 [Hymenoscyphus varicosporioides]